MNNIDAIVAYLNLDNNLYFEYIENETEYVFIAANANKLHHIPKGYFVEQNVSKELVNTSEGDKLLEVAEWLSEQLWYHIDMLYGEVA